MRGERESNTTLEEFRKWSTTKRVRHSYKPSLTQLEVLLLISSASGSASKWLKATKAHNTRAKKQTPVFRISSQCFIHKIYQSSLLISLKQNVWSQGKATYRSSKTLPREEQILVKYPQSLCKSITWWGSRLRALHQKTTTWDKADNIHNFANSSFTSDKSWSSYFFWVYLSLLIIYYYIFILIYIALALESLGFPWHIVELYTYLWSSDGSYLTYRVH